MGKTQPGRAIQARRAQWWRVGTAFAVPSVVFLFLVPVGVLSAVVAVAVVWTIVYGLVNAPSRYRRHSWGQIQQAVDHRFGRFGGTYREDSLDAPAEAPPVQRNDSCPCGSGRKYKRCCGRR